jgi:integrase
MVDGVVVAVLTQDRVENLQFATRGIFLILRWRDIADGLHSGKWEPEIPPHSTRQYGRLVRSWVSAIGLDPSAYGTHSMRRTKAALIYRKTGNLRAVQLLLGHTKVDSTVLYLGVELEDALSIAEKIDI